MNLLVNGFGSFYEDVIKFGNWTEIYISVQALKATETNINKEIDLGKIEEFIKSIGHKVNK